MKQQATEPGWLTDAEVARRRWSGEREAGPTLAGTEAGATPAGAPGGSLFPLPSPLGAGVFNQTSSPADTDRAGGADQVGADPSPLGRTGGATVGGEAGVREAIRKAYALWLKKCAWLEGMVACDEDGEPLPLIPAEECAWQHLAEGEKPAAFCPWRTDTGYSPKELFRRSELVGREILALSLRAEEAGISLVELDDPRKPRILRLPHPLQPVR